MSCGACIRWKRRPPPKRAPHGWRSRYGFCMAPEGGKEPYWRAERSDAIIMTADCHGAACEAFKEKHR